MLLVSLTMIHYTYIYIYIYIYILNLFDIQLVFQDVSKLLSGLISALSHLQGDRGAPGPVGPSVSRFIIKPPCKHSHFKATV